MVLLQINTKEEEKKGRGRKSLPISKIMSYRLLTTIETLHKYALEHNIGGMIEQFATPIFPFKKSFYLFTQAKKYREILILVFIVHFFLWLTT